jgi:hypothetical protein
MQKLLEQLAELLHQANDASKQTLKGPAPANAQEQLKMIQGMAAYFNVLNLQFLRDSGFSEEEIANPKPPPVSPENEFERVLLENCNRLAREAEKGYYNLTFGLKQIKRKKAAPKARKKKFDRLGGRDKWKPL